MLTGNATCTSGAAAKCTVTVSTADVRWSLGSSALMGAWHASIWASVKDGKAYAKKRDAGTVTLKR